MFKYSQIFRIIKKKGVILVDFIQKEAAVMSAAYYPNLIFKLYEATEEKLELI